MDKKRLILLGQLKEALQSKESNKENHCRGLINELIALETEQSDCIETVRSERIKGRGTVSVRRN